SSVLATDRFSARVMAVLAGLGLFLASIGLYGVVAYSVSQRTGEIGLRMALGAQPRSVIALVARDGGALVALGIVLAIPVMLVIARTLSDVLFDVRVNDPVILFALATLVALVAFTACLIPSIRALQLDPVAALNTGQS